jgi:hypothetical protein
MMRLMNGERGREGERVVEELQRGREKFQGEVGRGATWVIALLTQRAVADSPRWTRAVRRLPRPPLINLLASRGGEQTSKLGGSIYIR